MFKEINESVKEFKEFLKENGFGFKIVFVSWVVSFIVFVVLLMVYFLM